MPVWALLILAALGGWVFLNLYLHFYYKHLDYLLNAAGGVQQAPQDLVNAWQNDGGPLSFTFLFGWLYGLLYLGGWSLIYAVLAFMRGSRQRGRSAAV